MHLGRCVAPENPFELFFFISGVCMHRLCSTRAGRTLQKTLASAVTNLLHFSTFACTKPILSADLEDRFPSFRACASTLLLFATHISSRTLSLRGHCSPDC